MAQQVSDNLSWVPGTHKKVKVVRGNEREKERQNWEMTAQMYNFKAKLSEGHFENKE